MVGDPWEMHTSTARCLDWSLNGLEVASGSKDGTVKCWNPDAGQQIGPTIDTGHDWVVGICKSFAAERDSWIVCFTIFA